MSYTIRQADPRPALFTRRGRPGGITGIHQFQIHATRGPTTMESQVQATENWFANGPDRGGWGASADFVVGPDHREGGKIVIVQFLDWIRQFSSWSAGYGSGGAATTYGAAEVGIAIEVAQPPSTVGGKYVGGESDVPFTEATMDATAWLCNHLNDELERLGGTRIPSQHIDTWDQLRLNPIPRGFIGHEDLANGQRRGKTDPGQMWDWDAFIDSLDGEPDEVMSPTLTRYAGTIAAWQHGTTPLPMDGRVPRYEIRVERRT